MSSVFKAGDMVRQTGGYKFSNGSEFATIKSIETTTLGTVRAWFEETNTYLAVDLIQLAPPPTVDLTKPVQTRDGRKARVICTNAAHTNPGFHVVALVTNEHGNEQVFPFAADGSFGDRPYPLDLVNVPEVKFFNLMWDGPMKAPFDTREEAEATGKRSYGYKYTFELTL